MSCAAQTIAEVLEARRIGAEDSVCPQCDGPQCADLGLGSCDKCEIFQCSHCARWVSWEVGGADQWPGLCATCWCINDLKSNPCGFAYPPAWLKMMRDHMAAGCPVVEEIRRWRPTNLYPVSVCS